MQANSYTPYALKDMYQTIDLIDRKIASCESWETFPTQDARESHLRKLSTKRAALVKSALALTNLGVECDPRFLPRSYAQLAQQQAASTVAEAIEGVEIAETAETEAPKVRKPARARLKSA
jgi:hypothetical protein